MESLLIRNSKKELVPSTIPFYPKVISTLKPTLQKVISKEDLHIVIFFTRSQYEFTKTVLEKEIHTIHDASTNVTISTLDKFPISTKDLESLLVNQTAKNLLYCFHFLLTPKELKEIVPFTKSRRIGLCAIQYPSFFHVGGSLLYEYPAENIVNFVHTEKENEFLWFIWGTRSNTRSEYMTLSIKQHEMLPRHLEEGLVIKRRLEEGESMESLAREFQMDRSTLHKKVKVAKYLDQYPQLRHFSLNKGLEFVRSLEENNSLSNRGHREPAKRARKEWTKWSDGIPLLSQAAMTLQHVPTVVVSETNSSPLSTSPLSSPLNSIE